MLDPDLGTFAHVVAMDLLIHYQPEDLVAALSELAQRTTRSILFTFAPRTRLRGDNASGRQGVPEVDRSPAIDADRRSDLRQLLASLPGWTIGRTQRIPSGFYTAGAGAACGTDEASRPALLHRTGRSWRFACFRSRMLPVRTCRQASCCAVAVSGDGGHGHGAAQWHPEPGDGRRTWHAHLAGCAADRGCRCSLRRCAR